MKSTAENSPLLQPQEIEVHYILPTLRRELARELKDNGKSQKEIAAMFGVSEAAVSQYFHEKRGAGIGFTSAIRNCIRSAAKRITSRISFIREAQQLLQQARKERFICSLCRNQNRSSIPKGCGACFE